MDNRWPPSRVRSPGRRDRRGGRPQSTTAKRGGAWRVTLVALALVGTLGSPALAQQPDSASQSEPPRFMWRGRPLPECSSFLITEIGVLKPIGDWGTVIGDDEPALVGDYGFMWNVSPREAYGPVAHLEVGSYRSRLGVGVRRRAWISRDFSVDLQVGAVLLGSQNDPWHFHGPGLLVAGNVTFGGWFVLHAQSQTRSIREGFGLNTGDYGPTNRELQHHLGVKLGSGPGGGGTGVAMAAALVVFVAIATSGIGG